MKEYIKPVIEVNLFETNKTIADDSINGSAGQMKTYTNEVTKGWNQLF